MKRIDIVIGSGKRKRLGIGPGAIRETGNQHLNATSIGRHSVEEHFGAVAECLVATLKELGVGEDDINDVVNIAVSVKDDVLNK